MKYFDDYDLKYPGLIIKIIEYFNMSNGVKEHSILKFCEATGNNQDLDIAFIDIGKNDSVNVPVDDGEVLQDILALGYPKIPAFTDFLTAEKATISNKAKVRLTPSKGAITAFGYNYLAKTELCL